MIRKNLLRNKFPQGSPGGDESSVSTQPGFLMFIISSDPIRDSSEKNKSFSDSSRSLGQDKLSWWLKSHHMHLSNVLVCNCYYDK